MKTKKEIETSKKEMIKQEEKRRILEAIRKERVTITTGGKQFDITDKIMAFIFSI